MAITFDTAATGISPLAVFPITFPITIAAGSNRLLAVPISGRYAGYTGATVTFNGVSCIEAVTVFANTMQSAVFYLVAPDVGTHDVVVTPAFTVVSVYASATAISLQGVAQTSPVEVIDTNSSASAQLLSLTNLITTTDGCAIVDSFSGNGGALTMTPETNRVERFNGPDTGEPAMGVSTIITKSPAGAVTMEWDANSAVACVLSGVAFKPFVAPPAGDFSGGPDNILIGQPRFASGGPSIGMGF